MYKKLRIVFTAVVAVLLASSCINNESKDQPADKTSQAERQLSTQLEISDEAESTAEWRLNSWHRKFNRSRENLPDELSDKLPKELPHWQDLSSEQRELLSNYEHEAIMGKLLIQLESAKDESETADTLRFSDTPISDLLAPEVQVPVEGAVLNPTGEPAFGDIRLIPITGETRADFLNTHAWAEPFSDTKHLYMLQVYDRDRPILNAVTGIGSTSELTQPQEDRLKEDVVSRPD